MTHDGYPCPPQAEDEAAAWIRWFTAAPEPLRGDRPCVPSEVELIPTIWGSIGEEQCG